MLTRQENEPTPFLATYCQESPISLKLVILYQNNGVTSVLLGSKNLAHVQKNMELLEREIDKSVMDQALALTA